MADEEEITIDQDTEFEIITYPSKTFKIDWNDGHINGYVDGIDALKQAIDVILSVERYKWAIFSWQYGNELTDSIGERYEYVQSNVKRMITDALTQDDRILSVSDFTFSYPDRTSLGVAFTVNTTFGTTTAEVNVDAL